MNIPAISNINFASPLKQKENNSSSRFGLTMAKPLSKDTVSFGQRTTNKLADFVEVGFSKDRERLNRLAITYLDVLESIAIKLKEFGVSFDRAYCELNPVKSTESYISKIKRSKDLKVRDTIRATLYVQNPYDLTITTDRLLPELEKRGYVVAENYVPVETAIKHGYIPPKDKIKKGEVLMPDLDFRLADVETQVTKIPEKYRYSIGGPQKSGYEDIQMRLVRGFESSKNPTQHELLILFGPNYAEAKHIEAEKVYNVIRKFDETSITRKDDADIVNRYIDLIKKMITGKFSSKLYDSAKNKDMGIPIEVRISFTPEDQADLDRYFKELNTSLSEYYKNAKKVTTSSKSKESLEKELRKDRAIIKKLQEDIQKTIEYFQPKTENVAETTKSTIS